ncbi:uncharacterized protein NECHADRAFT_53386 [Fusarium vanettenii 77-13-4]|uniref:NAD-dependent epimerase/dehydratase domain-containing protein n=1 Tax=Fusarium vanettenii (strain ATCC MYA-4622 / CBS 123669 / FGSC 9596 / NRRL 45880 / 77-13-4) TaxID=660122 RepID=C7ZEG3_FUSV7|nr:uncharacterized protein NECHADRAFT_53386 [Fusarium vanettenii 77-13-4]EEU37671.1 hypothetical protein NECHADRAFT_53386 [Fusarium vanettenii 77-13-4]
MAPLDNLAVPKGSTVLVTGANGLLGSHISKQFLEFGYNVRGTVRNPEKNAWLKTAFDKEYGQGRFEFFQVPDMVAEGAFNEAVKGVAVVAHSASIMSLDPNPNNVIPGVIAGAINALKAAYAEPSVKRFVYTSSSSATVIAEPSQTGINVTEETWNEDSIKKAWADPPYTMERAADTYGASKAQAEQEVWKYYKEHRDERPDIVVNTVLPNFNFGRSIDPANQGYPSSSALPALLYNGLVTGVHHLVVPQYFVDVDDTGRLHVAAGILDHVKGQRIFAYGGRFNWDEVLEVLRKTEPSKTFPENFSGGRDANEYEGRAKAEQLLRDLGRPGWTTLEETIVATVEGLREAGDKLKVRDYEELGL